MADIFNKFGAKDMNQQRLRRSEALLAQLYRDEVDPPFTVPNIPGLRVMAVLSVISILLFSATLFYKFNNFIMLREEVFTKQGNLESSIQRRHNLFGNLINVALNHAALEHAVFANTSKMRSDLVQRAKEQGMSLDQLLGGGAGAGAGAGATGALADEIKGIDELLKGGNFEASLGRLMAVVEQYPNIQSSQTYHQLMTSLVEMEDLIATRRVEYNTALREYNMAISKFPWYLLAQITDFGRLDYFSIAKNSDVAPVVTQEQLERLNPLREHEGN
ncbi:MAG: LemA family protein [Alphaproteobacteria bacterium]|nr:LemA family protein [Alphaproteobacteria bacterium]MBF0250899.1 LemA family protein [Alphaproteobacteria bacterium]